MRCSRTEKIAEIPSEASFRLRSMMLPGCLLLVLNFFLLGWTSIHHSEYCNDFQCAVNPDAVTYVQLGKNIWNEGAYSRNPLPPFRPDFKWTPVYPVLAGWMDRFGGVSAILCFNIFLTLGSSFLLARLTFYYTHSIRAAQGMGLLFALDPLLWSLNLQAMSDVTFLLFLILGAFWTFPALFPAFSESSSSASSPTKNLKFRILPLLAGGTAFSLAILTRPTGLYVPAVLLLAFFGGAFAKRISEMFKQKTCKTQKTYKKSNFIQNLLLALLFLLSAYLPLTLWMLRNAHVFGKFELCGNQNIVMVYYTGAGAWEVEHGGTLEEAQTRIQHEFHLPSVVECHNPESFALDPAQIDTQLAACKRSVLFKYPISLGISSVVGAGKSLAAHETQTLAEITHASGSQTPRSSRNPAIFIWSLVFQGTLLLTSLFFFLLERRTILRKFSENPAFCLAIAGLAAYFLLTMMLSGVECCARYRLPLVPFLYMCTVISFGKNLSFRHNLSKT